MRKRREYIHSILDSAFYSTVGIGSKEELIEELLVQAIRNDVEVKSEEGVAYSLSYIMKGSLEQEETRLTSLILRELEENSLNEEEIMELILDNIIKHKLGSMAMLRIKDPLRFRDYILEITNRII